MAKTPDYMADFDALFGDAGYEKYLSGLTSQGGAVVGLKDPATTAKPTQQNYDPTDVTSVAEMAKVNGWADPYAFNTDMLTDVEQSYTGGGESGRDPANFGFAKFKDPASRGITDTGRNLNRVHVDYAPNEDGTYYGSGVSGYKVLAGAVPGTKNHTSLFYQYDKDGKFQGANFDMEERGLEGAAPLVGMAGMALGFGGGLGAIGSSLNSSLGLGLGKVGTSALGGAAYGGGVAALTGQNPLKGAAMGALGAGITAANPAGYMGLSGAPARFVNSTISNTVKSSLNRKTS